MNSETEKNVIVPLLLENYLHMAKASVGSPLFRNLYCTVNGEKRDILRGGDLSCAFFVSSILLPFRLLKDIHATVSGTARDLKESGWTTINEPKPGAIIIWSPRTVDGESHAHIGISIDEGFAVSNDYKTKVPQITAWDYRPVEEILWHPKLDQKNR